MSPAPRPGPGRQRPRGTQARSPPEAPPHCVAGPRAATSWSCQGTPRASRPMPNHKSRFAGGGARGGPGAGHCQPDRLAQGICQHIGFWRGCRGHKPVLAPSLIVAQRRVGKTPVHLTIQFSTASISAAYFFCSPGSKQFRAPGSTAHTVSYPCGGEFVCIECWRMALLAEASAGLIAVKTRHSPFIATAMRLGRGRQRPI